MTQVVEIYPRKTRTYILDIVSNMDADVLVMQEARASATWIINMLN